VRLPGPRTVALALVHCRGALRGSGRGSPSTPIFVTRLATKATISLRRSSWEPFSISAVRVIVRSVIVRSVVAFGSSQTRANVGSDHDQSLCRRPRGRPLGKGLKGCGSPVGLLPPSVERPLVSYIRTSNPTQERKHEHYRVS
jgi:hypothetical protein